ncbi:MAG: hypothetical protein ACI9JM_000403 [Halioglobus sp.]|jgi:hypothetical protein
MLKKSLLGLLLILIVIPVGLFVVGKGYFGDAWQPAAVTAGPRPVLASTAADATPQILFGDLHSHTNYSIDAYIFNTGAVKGGGVVTPADACDFARYCSALDFWSINDHAEGLTPRVWADTVDSIRDCNDAAGDPGNPDMVSFVGWEWSNGDKNNVANHYGHKNVVIRTWEEGQTPLRPIASQPEYILTKVPSMLVGLLGLVDTLQETADLGWYLEESKGTPACTDDVPTTQLPLDCREVALTPLELYRKLDEWGFDSMVIPHGLAWGVTNPLTGDFQDQLDEYEQRYQNLLEIYSGHGNSELFDDFQRVGISEDGQVFCPLATNMFTPCCQQAGILARKKCERPDSSACDMDVADTKAAFAKEGAPEGRRLFPDATLDDWEGCGQLQNSFQPSAMYVPLQSAQYTMALGFDKQGEAKRARFGLIGSSDGHQARPGSSYKESNRLLYTDHKDQGRGGLGADFYKVDKESGGFYYTGGLVAAHSEGRHRDAIWEALTNRNVYATSGDRMLVWFDLLNGPSGEVPMGSEVYLQEVPRFRVKALGALEQIPGCPDYTIAALGTKRAQSLCGGECYRAGDQRKAITRIEIVRIRPQVSPDEKVAPLIENQWRVFDCPADGTGCSIEFEDPDFLTAKRPALYYARVIQQAEPLIVGDPFGCEYDDEGQCVKRNYCIGDNAKPDNNCLAEAEPRAWTSPIFVEYLKGIAR